MLKDVRNFTALTILGLALYGDYKGTVINITTMVAVRGAAYLTTKLIEVMDEDMKNVTTFTSICLGVVPFIKILKTARGVLIPMA